VNGKKVVFANTAPGPIMETLLRHLQDCYKCSVVGTTNTLSDRGRLYKELNALLASSQKPDVLLTELKAASVQVALPLARAAGVEVVFCSNVPVEVAPESGSLSEAVTSLARRATEMYALTHPERNGR